MPRRHPPSKTERWRALRDKLVKFMKPKLRKEQQPSASWFVFAALTANWFVNNRHLQADSDDRYFFQLLDECWNKAQLDDETEEMMLRVMLRPQIQQLNK